MYYISGDAEYELRVKDATKTSIKSSLMGNNNDFSKKTRLRGSSVLGRQIASRHESLNVDEKCYDNDYKSNKSVTVGKGSLTKQLLSQGLLSPKMLADLQKEWEKQQTSHSMDDDHNFTTSKSRKFKRTSRKPRK